MARKDVVQIRCSEIEKERWRLAAEAERVELSGWIRQTLDKAARMQEARQALDEGARPTVVHISREEFQRSKNVPPE